MSPRNLMWLSSLVALMLTAYIVEGSASAQEQRGIVLTALGTEHDEAEDNRQLTEFLIGTKWLMYEIPGRIVEFGQNGRFELEDWKKQGIAARWKVTGAKQVTVTVFSQKFRNLTATLNFDDRLGFFTGTDLGGKREITKSPRINSVPNDPADPERR